jgi:carboxymethylenebutenolidase
MCSPFRPGPAGRAEVHEFYANRFLPNIPDWELTSLSETFGCDRIVEEFVVRFTHTLQMDWMLPGVPVTDRGVEFAMALVIQFEGSKIANERLYWDQATVLSQLGVLDNPLAAAGTGSAHRLLKLR